MKKRDEEEKEKVNQRLGFKMSLPLDRRNVGEKMARKKKCWGRKNHEDPSGKGQQCYPSDKM